jgi:hypothetical protein
MTPFVAAAAQRASHEELFELTSRLHQVMLSAASLAARQRAQLGTAAGTAGANAADGPDKSPSMQDLASTDLDSPSSWQQDDLQGQSSQQGGSRSSSQQGMQHKESSAKLAARMRRLAARREASEARLQRRQLRQQSKQRQGSQDTAASSSSNGLAGHSRRVHITDLRGQAYARSSNKRKDLMDTQLGLGDGGSQLEHLADQKAAQVASEDLVHPWSWDVTQSLTVLSGGIKVGIAVAPVGLNHHDAVQSIA